MADDLLERLAKLSPEKRTRLLAALSSANEKGRDFLPLRRRVATEAPLTNIQQQWWFLDQLDPEAPTGAVPHAFSLDGPLNAAAVQQALDEVCRRHAIRSTVFRTDEADLPVQRVEGSAPLRFPLLELSGLDTELQEVWSFRPAQLTISRPFTPSQGRLFRAGLARMSQCKHVGFLAVHHFVSDGWSVGVVVDEFCRLYAEFSTGRPSPFSELSIRYTDFAAWEHDRLQGERLEKDLGFWRELLSDPPDPPQPPSDFLRPAMLTGEMHTTSVEWRAAELRQIRELATRFHVTLFTVLLTAFNALLARWSGQLDILVGTPMANRPSSRLEGVVGFFVNFGTLRTNLSDDPSLEDLARRVSSHLNDILQFAHVPFPMVLKAIGSQSGRERLRLHKAWFQLHDLPPVRSPAPGLTLQSCFGGHERLRFDAGAGSEEVELAMYSWQTDENLVTNIEGSVDVFTDNTVKGVGDYFRTLVNLMVSAPDTRLSELPALPPSMAGAADAPETITQSYCEEGEI